MGLFLEGIFDTYAQSPNKVIIDIPVYKAGSETLVGLLASEVSIGSGNKWGPVISDVSTLTDISAILGDAQIFTWIGASTNCWKGTNPISLALDMYLINYKRNLDLEDKIKYLTKLTALTQYSDVRVVTHGGYTADVLEGNTTYFTQSFKDLGEGNDLTTLGKNYFTQGSTEGGTVSVTLGNRIRISNLLVSRIDTTPSNVEVVDGKPLYYRVNISFIGVRPLLSTDVDSMFLGI